MQPSVPSLHGNELLSLLPEIYRERDRENGTTHAGHLREYLASHGILLDRLRNTIEQLHADHFPDVPKDGRVCQEWVIPYLAQLVGAVLYSPLADGQRAEVANAVRWAKRKGTLKVAEEIAEAITQTEAELQEGFKRIVRSVVPGETIHAANFYGEVDHPIDAFISDPTKSFATVNPQMAARHCGIPTATIELRKASRAILAPIGSSGAHATRFGTGSKTGWRQNHPNGAPCHPQAYEDISRRSVDMRDPDLAARNGRYHPKRLLVHLPPPAGFFSTERTLITLPSDWATTGTLHGSLRRLVDHKGEISISNISDKTIVIENDITIENGAKVTLSNLVFDKSIALNTGTLNLSRCAVRNLQFGPAVEDRRLNAKSCLFNEVSGHIGFATLEYVTILLNWTAAAKINASEVIFPDGFDGKRIECARYSSFAADALAAIAHHKSCTKSRPLYRSSIFGSVGAGVLSQNNEPALLSGAEDGGEIGAFHEWYHAAQREALKLKLLEYLPMGITPVIVWDERLLITPPALR